MVARDLRKLPASEHVTYTCERRKNLSNSDYHLCHLEANSWIWCQQQLASILTAMIAPPPPPPSTVQMDCMQRRSWVLYGPHSKSQAGGRWRRGGGGGGGACSQDGHRPHLTGSASFSGLTVHASRPCYIVRHDPSKAATCSFASAAMVSKHEMHMPR